LDDAEHGHGPYSAEADADLEAIDGMLSRLVAAARSNDPTSVAVIVSDHGFVALTHVVHLTAAFLEAGLIDATINPDTQTPAVKEWKAVPWTAGGMAAVVLRDPADQSTLKAVRDLLHSLAANAANGIAEVVEAGDPIAERGAFPTASFLIVMKSGYYLGSNTSGPLVTAITGHGGHGFAPTDPDMRAALFVAGVGIAHHRDLGLIDMRQIAPTVAALLGVPLPSATAKPLPVRQ
jgi:predicted AlkP superfamily pyrophosphatase or phosphodiesterase